MRKKNFKKGEPFKHFKQEPNRKKLSLNLESKGIFYNYSRKKKTTIKFGDYIMLRHVDS
jgi:hypothetical protein